MIWRKLKNVFQPNLTFTGECGLMLDVLNVKGKILKIMKLKERAYLCDPEGKSS